jgi:hypothetical protein
MIKIDDNTKKQLIELYQKKGIGLEGNITKLIEREDDEDFNEVLELSQKSKDKMIQGTIKYLESKGIEVDLDSVNREIRKLSKDMFLIYVDHY